MGQWVWKKVKKKLHKWLKVLNCNLEKNPKSIIEHERKLTTRNLKFSIIDLFYRISSILVHIEFFENKIKEVNIS